ncbi:MAG: hypothetical protein QOG57_133, partial [Pseudonocardiales bacterium]|nr:hypothetical protein [Pseudonocardiales bacterium]
MGLPQLTRRPGNRAPRLRWERPGPATPATPRRRGPGLRLRLTVLCTVLAALVSALLLWLGWLLVGGVVSAVPALPPGT